MSLWPAWDRTTNPGGLAGYAQPEVTRRLLPAGLASGLPGTGGAGTVAEKARALYDTFARVGIRYVAEPTLSDGGGQRVRPVDQVLARPRQGTCVDVAVTYAGACLDAGLHPIVVVLDPRHGGGSAHAVVLVWLDGTWPDPAAEYPLGGEAHTAPPTTRDGVDLLEEIRTTPTAPGAFLPVDVTGATWRDAASGASKDWDTAVTDAAAMLRATTKEGGSWAWGVGVDVGATRAGGAGPIFDPPEWPQPSRDVIARPYLQHTATSATEDGLSPLAVLKPRTGIVPFYPRDELDILLDWAHTPAPPSPGGRGRVSVAVVHGVGGAGKTHLAAELCTRLDSEGWYAGFLPKSETPSPAELAWLAGVVCPVLVVVDYVEDSRTDQVIALLKALASAQGPVRALLTGRSLGPWQTQIDNAYARDGHTLTPGPVLALPRRHPATTGVFRRAAARFAHVPGMTAPIADAPPVNPRWTTLDLILQAWLAATGLPTDQLPTARDTLYDEILRREFSYWQRVCTRRGLPEYDEDLLADVGAVTTLVAPADKERLIRAIGAVDEFAAPGPERTTLAGILTGLLAPDGADDGYAIRPDPIGEHLVLRELIDDRELLNRALPPDPPTGPSRAVARARRELEQERLRACVVITRAAEDDPDTASAMADTVLELRPAMWEPALEVTFQNGGPFATALDVLARKQATPLPLADLARSLPLGHAALSALALTATQLTPPREPDDGADYEGLARVAGWVMIRAARLAESGQLGDALLASQKAISDWRTLTAVDPAAFAPGLARSLVNHAVWLADGGQREDALIISEEAVSLSRALAETDPAARNPDLATALANHSVRLSEAGRHDEALVVSEEAISLKRALIRSNAAAHTPELAISLANHAVRLSDVGRREDALITSEEAVAAYRALASANPAAHSRDFALSLSNHAARLAEAGAYVDALATSEEAVRLRRALVTANPAAYTPDLAASLTNHANWLAKNGRRQDALTVSEEAIHLHRDLAETNPAARTPELAAALINHAARLAEDGQTEDALSLSEEAVSLHRDLARTNPAVYERGLAVSLTGHSALLAQAGRAVDALFASEEAVRIGRALAATNPDRFSPDLATTLANHAVRLAKSGRGSEALTVSAEAVRIRRALAEANPAAYSRALARSLTEHAVRLFDAGQPEDALTASAEALRLRRELAAKNPGADTPELAISLNSHAILSASTRGYAEALTVSEEAVRAWRALAAADPAAHSPGLAGSLANHALRLAEVGRREDALSVSIEAVDTYRDLATARPTTYNLAFASTLNNHANRLAEAGRFADALEVSAEAVRIYRSLAAANPAAHDRELAVALTSHAALLAMAGKRDDALPVSEEAVGAWQALAMDNAAAHTPNLAKALSNHAARLSETGRDGVALSTSEEAVRTWRGLAAERPSAYAADFAMSLDNHSTRLSRAGRHDDGLRTSEEALGIWRSLTAESPALHTRDYASSLANNATLLTESGRREDALESFEHAWSALPAVPRAQLILARAEWRSRRVRNSADAAPDETTDLEGTIADLALTAATLGDSEDPRAGQLRRAVRSTLQPLRGQSRLVTVLVGHSFPAWATAPLADDVVNIANGWAAAADWERRDALLREHHSPLEEPAVRQQLGLLRALYPEATSLADLTQILALTDEQGLEPVLAELAARDSHGSTLREWLSSPTLDASRAYLVDHPDLISDPRTQATLQAIDDPGAAAQHLAIVRLAAKLGTDETYDAITDPAIATDLALTLLEALDLHALAELWTAAPGLARTPFTAPYLAAVTTALNRPSDADTATESKPNSDDLMRLAAQEATSTQCAAGTARLRRAAARHPDASGTLNHLADVLQTARVNDDDAPDADHPAEGP